MGEDVVCLFIMKDYSTAIKRKTLPVTTWLGLEGTMFKGNESYEVRERQTSRDLMNVWILHRNSIEWWLWAGGE